MLNLTESSLTHSWAQSFSRSLATVAETIPTTDGGVESRYAISHGGSY